MNASEILMYRFANERAKRERKIIDQLSIGDRVKLGGFNGVVSGVEVFYNHVALTLENGTDKKEFLVAIEGDVECPMGCELSDARKMVLEKHAA